jgi:hypothetical protein
MEWLLNGFVGLGLVGVAFIITFFMCAIVWPYYMYHRRRVMEIKGTHSRQVTTLEERVEKLEKKCAALQEQITDAHMLLADERRLLDKKLSETFPEIIAPASEPIESPKNRSTKRERARE